MHNSEVQKDCAYGEFFMNSNSLKRHAHGSYSTIDSVVFNRDIDASGEKPHESSMSRWDGFAGKKSTQIGEPGRPFRKPGISMTSTMDNVIWGRDFDRSGDDPHEEFLKSYANHAGKKAGVHPVLHRNVRRGEFSGKSVMDEVLWGRDVDQSGVAPHKHFESTYSGHAGVRTLNPVPRPFRKNTCAQQTTADEVIFGRDTDMSGPNPQKDHMTKHYKEHAGLKSDERVQRPFRKTGIALQATVDDVVFHRDIDGSGENPQVQLFTTIYAGHAGRKSGAPRTVAKHSDPRDPRFGGSGSYRYQKAMGSAPCDCGRSRSQPPPLQVDDSIPAAGFTHGRPLSARIVRSRSVGRDADAAAHSVGELKRTLSARELKTPSTAAPSSPVGAIFVDQRSTPKGRPASDAGSAASRTRLALFGPDSPPKSSSRPASVAGAGGR